MLISNKLNQDFLWCEDQMSKHSARSSKNGNKNVEQQSVVQAEETRGCLVLFADNDDAVDAGMAELRSLSGINEVRDSRDYGSSQADLLSHQGSGILRFENLRVAVVNGDLDQCNKIQAATPTQRRAILAIEPEGVVKEASPYSEDYWRGYRDGLQPFIKHYDQKYDKSNDVSAEADDESSDLCDDEIHAWGLKATKVDQSEYSGRGVKIAILDSGLEDNHTDFIDRLRVPMVFEGESMNDRTGHGTHCTGIALGPLKPASGVKRYGCASGGDMFVGKVLEKWGDDPRQLATGTDRRIIAGINWALGCGCRIISMSLGEELREGEIYSAVYEGIAKRALNSSPGTLILAATGNGSDRPDRVAKALRQASCPSILGVGAINPSLDVAKFSNAGANIAAPGVSIFSAGSAKGKIHSIRSGTSMATPYVAGILAMWLEAQGLERNMCDVRDSVLANVRKLNCPDIGAGMVQAPIRN